MKQQVTREVSVCDVCENEKTTYDECIVCGREMCLSCQATIAGCIVSSNPETCWKCAERDDVLAVYAEWAPRIRAVRKQRDEELRALGKVK